MDELFHAVMVARMFERNKDGEIFKWVALNVLPGLRAGLFMMNHFRAQHIVVLGHRPRPTEPASSLRAPEVVLGDLTGLV